MLVQIVEHSKSECSAITKRCPFYELEHECAPVVVLDTAICAKSHHAFIYPKAPLNCFTEEAIQLEYERPSFSRSSDAART